MNGRYTPIESYSVIRTILVIALQVVVITTLLLHFRNLSLPAVSADLTLGLLVPGVALGITEMTCFGVAAEYVIGAYNVAARHSRFGSVPPSVWMDSSRAGWMGQLHVAIRVMPGPTGPILVCLQVACEEVMFRHCFPLLIGGAVTGPVVSGALFVGMQATGMPRARSAVFPMVGAGIMAAVHSALYSRTGQLLPLVVAHAACFLLASRAHR
ncbi:CPBP family glutamic-type intramembrane protease [Virgisporangium aurantiacum]|uniref:CPBP family glutamic-type intramembrane protease n=1 Tax=Virgisporangium aurantiacum TaxID=175570 RepID=UPI00194DCFD0|nr:CPBP family glutamic-type intramembrane protease [Virgisporangium aurantiacum]